MRLKSEAPAPLAGGYRGGSAVAGGFATDHNVPIELLLSRLQGVRRAGRDWMACCPAHEVKSPSLAVGVGKDGQAVLLHCFAGCTALQVVGALGMSLSDLFSKNPAGAKQHECNSRQQIARETGWRAAFSTVVRESTILEIAANDLTCGFDLSGEDRQRLLIASARIHAAWEVLNEQRCRY